MNADSDTRSIKKDVAETTLAATRSGTEKSTDLIHEPGSNSSQTAHDLSPQPQEYASQTVYPDPDSAVQTAATRSVSPNSPVTSPNNLDIKQATDELNWSELAFELELDALARQFALNSVVLSFRDNQLKLAFLPELEVMFNSDLEHQIKKAIEAKLGLSLNIEFLSQRRLNVETPQQAGERKQEQARLRVIEDIQQDPVVQQLNALFGAELIHQSVKKRNG